MPILTVSLPAGYSGEQKSAFLKHSTQAVVDAIGVPLSTVRIVIQEYAPEHTIVAGEFGARHVLYIVRLIEGRTVELKAALIAALSRTTSESLGISEDNVRIILDDVPKSDMGVAGGISALAAGR